MENEKFKKLSFAGISEQELQIYEAALIIKKPTVLSISQQAGVPRTNVYRILENLEKKGLVSTIKIGRKQQFIPEPPSRLIEILKQHERTVYQELPRLKKLFLTYRHRPSVRLFEEEAGVRTFWEEVISDRPKEIWGFSNFEDLFARYPDFAEQFSKRRARLKIPVYIIALDSSKARERQKNGLAEYRYIKLLKKKELKGIFHSSIITWKNKVALFSYQFENIVVLIESREIALAVQALLKLYWVKLN